MSSNPNESRDIVIDGVKITPEILKALRNITNYSGPEIKSFFTEQCLVLAAVDRDQIGLDPAIFELFLAFHHLLVALFDEKGGHGEES